MAANLSPEYLAFQDFHAAQMGQFVPGLGHQASPFVLACIEQAIATLERHFPEDAALLRAGDQPATIADSSNGWMVRPLGHMILPIQRAVCRMRNPHPASTPEQSAVSAWFDLLICAEVENAELGAWGRPCSPRKTVIQETETWMRSITGCPGVA